MHLLHHAGGHGKHVVIGLLVTVGIGWAVSAARHDPTFPRMVTSIIHAHDEVANAAQHLMDGR